VITLTTLLIFALFFTSLLFSFYKDITIIYPLLGGLVCFAWLAIKQGYSPSAVYKMMRQGAKSALIVLKILLLIGILTAVWRASGTIPYIIYYSIAFISAKYFILSAFLLSCTVAFLLGSSFGTAGTIGVVLVILAKSGQVDLHVVAGAVIAGAYFGDRCSPMSSSANLVASLTRTDLHTNIRNMFKSVFPFILSLIGYTYLSCLHPLTFADNQVAIDIAKSFNLHVITALPAAIMLVPVFFRIKVQIPMIVSIVSGIAIALVLQHKTLYYMLYYIIMGFNMDETALLDKILAGGGLYSMLKVSMIVLISSAYSGIFAETGLLKNLESVLEYISQKIRVYPTIIITSVAAAAFACNQTLAVMLTHQLEHKIYEKRQINSTTLALDLENTVIVLSALIPWNIAGAVPAAILSTDAGFIPYAFYLFLIPFSKRLPE
jgi:NhaC family Na+:H+ antiporter